MAESSANTHGIEGLIMFVLPTRKEVDSGPDGNQTRMENCQAAKFIKINALVCEI